MNLNTVLITGGSSGIGAACVKRFARAGWRTVFVYHQKKDAAEALCRELCGEGLSVRAVRCDLSSADETHRTAGMLVREEKNITALVNNAGVSHAGLFQEMTDEQWRTLMAVNLDAPAALLRAFLPGMISRRRGAVVNVASMWGEVGASCEAAYSASKAGLIGLTRALAKELGPSGIRVNAVSPGLIDTAMNRTIPQEALDAMAEDTPLGRMGTPEEVAEAIFFLCSDQAGFITGQVLGINGGLVV